MNIQYQLMLAVVAALGLTSCANLERQGAERFRLGSTSQAQVVGQMGAPDSEDAITAGGKRVHRAWYMQSFTTTPEPASEPGIRQYRQRIFYFDDTVLVGDLFVSSYAKDSTEFYAGIKDDIKLNETTRVEIVERLGRPAGEFIWPMTKDASTKKTVYKYTTARRTLLQGWKMSTRRLDIDVDANGRVIAIDFREGEGVDIPGGEFQGHLSGADQGSMMRGN